MTAQRLIVRIGRALLAIVIAASATFLILRLLPGGPTTLMLEGINDPELEAELLAKFGLDQPLWVQFGLFWQELLQGNLGTSFYFGTPVTELLLSRLPWTIFLLGTSFVIALALSLPLGVWAAERQGRVPDRLVQILGIGGQATFVPGLAVLLLMVFAVGLGWLPVGGAADTWAVRSGGLDWLLNVFWHALLPIAVLVLVQLGSFTLTVRATMIQVFAESYMVTAVAKGLSRRRVIWGHGVRSALLPVLSLAGLELGTLVGGAVLTETVFAYPGVGLFIYESVLRQDYPVLQGAFIVLAIAVVLANLLIDVISGFLDPRVGGESL